MTSEFRPLTPLGKIHELARKHSARDMIECALERAGNSEGQGSLTFTSISASQARAAADYQDRVGVENCGPLGGVPISVKDLFDVAGDVTTGGSRVLSDQAPARMDALAVSRLRRAGAIIIGRTNMTEFAYSGIGLNPHYGTPSSVWDREASRIPGGSSSGAAVSVTDGMCGGALGTDTGGSIRIPATFGGLSGFKPTVGRVPTEGVLPLSRTLDSVGPIAPTVRCCADLDSLLTGGQPVQAEFPLQGLRLAVPSNALLANLDPEVESSFERATRTLSEAGALVSNVPVPVLDEIPAEYDRGGLLAIEAFAWHRKLLEQRGDEYDPRVSMRIRLAADRSASEYLDLVERREDIVRRGRLQTESYDALIFPTVSVVAPRIADMSSDEEYLRLNLLILRNTSVANYLGRCALSVPCNRPGEAPIGLTLMGEANSDLRLLAIGLSVERTLTNS